MMMLMGTPIGRLAPPYEIGQFGHGKEFNMPIHLE